jgi:hypothetical protein
LAVLETILLMFLSRSFEKVVGRIDESDLTRWEENVA